jgi:replicative DNA helicase
MRPTEDFLIASALPKPRLTGGVYSDLDFLLQQNIDESYFQDPHKVLFRVAVAANVVNTPIDDEVLAAMLEQEQVPQDRRLSVQIAFRDLSTLDVTREKIRILIPTFKDKVHAERMATALEEAAVVLTDSLTVDGESRSGYKAARTHIMARLSELDQKEQGVLPSQDIRECADELLAEYAETKKGREPGIMTGFREIDRLTNGFQRGELAIFCAYTGEGKTQLLLNLAYNAAINQQKNVVMVSLEMPVAQVRRRIISRHTNHGTFGLPGGLDYQRIKNGHLDFAEERLYETVINDWRDNPDYGRFHVLQLSKYDTTKVLNEKLMYLRSRSALDLVVLDYASLMAAVRRRSDRREEIVEVIEGLKALALTFNEGEGLCLVTANQVSRKAREEAESLRRYGLNFASETSAIEKNADFLAWLLRLDEFKSNKEVLMGVSKYRDGDVGSEFRLMERYESSLLTDIHSA